MLFLPARSEKEMVLAWKALNGIGHHLLLGVLPHQPCILDPGRRRYSQPESLDVAAERVKGSRWDDGCVRLVTT